MKTAAFESSDGLLLEVSAEVFIDATLLAPKCENLLVPVGASSSHVGFCALRLEPIWTAMGESAGVAAHLAREQKVALQKLEPAQIRMRLHQRGAGTIYTADVLPGHEDFKAVQWWGGLGGLHGLHAAFEQAGHRGAHLHGQYFEAFPGHAVGLDEALDKTTRDSWIKLAAENGIQIDRLEEARTKGEFIRSVFVNWQKGSR